MTTTVWIVLSIICVWLLAVGLGVAQSIVRALLEAEILGAFDDHLQSRVRTAAAQLPPHIAAHLEDEWLEELAAARDRPRLALRFVRGLPNAARAIGADVERAAHQDALLVQNTSANETATSHGFGRRPRSVLVIDDLAATVAGAVGELREHGNEIVQASTLEAALRLVRENSIDFVTIDQRLPMSEGDVREATDEQVEQLAASIGAYVPFVWLSAHDVSPERLSIPGCVGVILKSDDVSGDVEELLDRAVSR